MTESLGEVFGPLEYKGYLVFDYPEGENPINNIVFSVDSSLAGNLLIVDVPSPWSHSYSEGALTLSGGSLSPGGTVQVAVSVNKFFEEGEYPVSSIGTTTSGEQSSAIGVLLVGDLIILRFLEMLADYRLPLAGAMLGLAALEFLLTRRMSESDKAISRTCEKLLQECEKAKAEASNREAEAKDARAKADKAKKELSKAKEDLEKAKDRVDRINRDQKSDETSWVEVDGRRITSMDLKLKSDASKDLWDQYQNGEIDAQSLEEAWEELGEDSALEELRGQNKEDAEKKLKEAKDKVADAQKTADEAEKPAAEAEKKAAEARAYADKVCKEAEDCLKKGGGIVIDQGVGLTSDGELIHLDDRLVELGLSSKEFEGLSKLELNTDDPPTEKILNGIRVSPRLSTEVHQLDISPRFIPKFTDVSTDIHIPLPKIGKPLKPSLEQVLETGDSSNVNYRLFYKPKISYDEIVLVDLHGNPLIGTGDGGVPIEFDPSHRLPDDRSIPILGDLRIFELFRTEKVSSPETIILLDAKLIPSPN